jgi:DNA-directed RNA polymerase beta' subunit
MSFGRGVPCRDIVVSSHGLRCKCGSRDQRGRHEGHFGHLVLHMVAEAKEALDSLL